MLLAVKRDPGRDEERLADLVFRIWKETAEAGRAKGTEPKVRYRVRLLQI